MPSLPAKMKISLILAKSSSKNQNWTFPIGCCFIWKLELDCRLILGLSSLDINEIVMYKYWYDYAKLKYGKKAKPCYMDTDSFIVHVKLEDFYADLPGIVKKKSDTSNSKVKTTLH